MGFSSVPQQLPLSSLLVILLRNSPADTSPVSSSEERRRWGEVPACLNPEKGRPACRGCLARTQLPSAAAPALSRPRRALVANGVVPERDSVHAQPLGLRFWLTGRSASSVLLVVLEETTAPGQMGLAWPRAQGLFLVPTAGDWPELAPARGTRPLGFGALGPKTVGLQVV